MTAEPLRALRVLAGPRLASSRPVLVETEAGTLFTKLRGAAQGTGPLIAEMIVGELATALGLKVPRRAFVTLAADTPTNDKNDELGDLLAASVGTNLGLEVLEGARDLDRSEASSLSDDFACRVLWLDGLVYNVDRTPENRNVMVRRGEYWLIDNGAALPFQYHWPAVNDDTPRRTDFPVAAHLFASRAPALPACDASLAALLARDVVEAAVASVPDDFIQPLLSPRGPTLERRRRAYETFLWKRLKEPRPFLGGT